MSCAEVGAFSSPIQLRTARMDAPVRWAMNLSRRMKGETARRRACPMTDAQTPDVTGGKEAGDGGRCKALMPPPLRGNRTPHNNAI